MKALKLINLQPQVLVKMLLLFVAFSFYGNSAQVSAHGGEDHGEAKIEAATAVKGIVTRTAKLGDYEIMLKHSVLEPDSATTGRLFITEFATNEPSPNAAPAVEIESATGGLTAISVEKTDTPGNYTLKIPAMSEGVYTIRTKLTFRGETDTASFSKVEVARHASAFDGESGSSNQTALITIFFLTGLILFGGLTYFARRAFKDKSLEKETVSV